MHEAAAWYLRIYNILFVYLVTIILPSGDARRGVTPLEMNDLRESMAEANTVQAPLANELPQDLEVDSVGHRDIDSAIGDADRSTITTSLNSAFVNYRYEHGRRYHGFEDDAYCLPNDEYEIARLDMLHHIWKLATNNKIIIAPIPETIRNAVDIGTGSGAWAIDFAESHPEAEVLGTDLSPIQPSWVPPNCRFLMENAESEWMYEKPFDFIHTRFAMMGIRNWPRLIQQMWNNLEPGGWIELCEPSAPLGYRGEGPPTDSALYDYVLHLAEAQKVNGVDTHAAYKFREWLEAQGFADIGYQSMQWPIGAWAKGKLEKEVGYWTKENMKNHISTGVATLFTKCLGWTPEKSKEVVDKAAVGVDNAEQAHLYWQIHIWWARKPETVTT